MAAPQLKVGHPHSYASGQSSLGRVISIEGIPYSGKTTQSLRLMQGLRSLGVPLEQVHDLASNVASKAISGLANAADTIFLDATSEMLLDFAARHHVVNDVINPALGEGKWVVAEDFACSAYAYFHHARGLDRQQIREVDWISTGHFRVDLAIVLDLPVEDARIRQRAQSRSPVLHKRYRHEHHDQILREGYQALAKEDPERYQLVDASRSQDEIALDILSRVTEHFSQLLQPANS